VIVWVDAQLSPALAPWLASEFGVEAFSARYLNLVRAKDPTIFKAAKDANVVVLTKDVDFVLLQERFGPPPAILWIRCGNTSNAYLKGVLRRTFRTAQELLESGEPLVEIVDQPEQARVPPN
jgi:predicted nuclease of predicted toxin-antitoxin system